MPGTATGFGRAAGRPVSPPTCPSRSRSPGWSPRSTTTCIVHRMRAERLSRRALTELYLSTARGSLDELRRSLVGRGDWSRPAHALKGASANLGAVEMARLAAEAEHTAASPERLTRLELALDAV